MKDMKKKQMKVLAVVCALLALVGLGTAIYAAGFSSTITNTGNKGLVTSWSIKFGNSAFTSGATSADNTLKISEENIAPGSEGSFDILVGNASDVNAEVYIDLYNLRVGDAGNEEALNQDENNFRFYLDAGYTQEISVDETTVAADINAYDIINQTVAAKDGNLSTKIYWKWVGSSKTYTDASGALVSFDNKIAGKSIKVDFSVVVKQTEPTA